MPQGIGMSRMSTGMVISSGWVRPGCSGGAYVRGGHPSPLDMGPGVPRDIVGKQGVRIVVKFSLVREVPDLSSKKLIRKCQIHV